MRPFILVIIAFAVLSCKSGPENSWIRINQLGYMPDAVKTAVLVSNSGIRISQFSVLRASDGQEVYTSDQVAAFPEWGAFKKGYRLNFSEVSEPGEYYVKAKNIESPVFRIGQDVYSGTADYILNYMRQQRCGYNPFFKDSCHQKDGFIIFHPDKSKDSTWIDVRGGWHDATDYLQYVTTSANAVYQMLFACQQNPSVFADKYQANGDEGSNGIPDILDEARWGLDWLDRMNSSAEEMYNQLADDRDHIGFKLPHNDTADYGLGKGQGRPVYFCTGKPQGSEQNKNRATGIASTAGKYASAFALGSRLLEKYDPEFAAKIRKKAFDAYEHGRQHPGVCQTAPCISPYFYEEDNWVDDMELAAAQLYVLTREEKYLNDATAYGKQEPVTPWMGADTARHYQWYPFINMGHYYQAYGYQHGDQKLFDGYFRKGMDLVYERGKSNPFLIGIPFIWCSNNLVAAIATQCNLYRKATNDNRYREMEQSLVDWLFGCNPWGTSMIIGIPEKGDFPSDSHSAVVSMLKKQPVGGLVDGPIYRTIFGNLKGVHLAQEDPYAPFQSYVVYHDDHADYSTNEPTMDGTASLSYLLSSLEAEGKRQTMNNQ